MNARTLHGSTAASLATRAPPAAFVCNLDSAGGLLATDARGRAENEKPRLLARAAHGSARRTSAPVRSAGSDSVPYGKSLGSQFPRFAFANPKLLDPRTWPCTCIRIEFDCLQSRSASTRFRAEPRTATVRIRDLATLWKSKPGSPRAAYFRRKEAAKLPRGGGAGIRPRERAEGALVGWVPDRMPAPCSPGRGLRRRLCLGCPQAASTGLTPAACIFYLSVLAKAIFHICMDSGGMRSYFELGAWVVNSVI
uniref:Uncharacterized protein n=1 Tax=Oryza meridionalis TaxID=40149 RepID=A0A0E0CPL2_9ORYZ